MTVLESSAPPRVEECCVTVDGVRTYYRVVGEGESVVLAHGAGVSTAYWRPAQEALAARGPFRVYSLDFPGFGRSENPTWRPDVSRMTAHLHAWADAVVPGAFHLVGQSLGCEIAALAAVEWPERVCRMVLAGPASLPRLESLWRQILLAAVDAPRERLALFGAIIPAYLRCGPARLWQALRAQQGGSDVTTLRRLRQPVLVVRGERDPLVGEERVRAILRAVPHAETAVIPGAHGCHFTHAGEFASVVAAFVRSKR